MKLYTANQNSSVSSSAFKERKISNMMPSKPSDVLIFPLSSPTPRFSSTMARIHAVINAEVNKKYYYHFIGPLPVIQDVKPLSWPTPPECRFVFDNLSAETTSELFLLGLNVDGTQNNIMTGHPSPAAYPTIKAAQPLGQTFKIGFTDFEGYLAWNVGVRAMHMFSFTSLEARKVLEPAAYEIEGMVGDLVLGGEEIEVTRMGKGVTTTMKVENNRHGIRAKAVVEVLYPNYEFTADEFLQYELINLGDLKDHNIVLPYFEGLLLPDKNYCYDQLLSLFNTCFGPTASGIYEIIRRGFGTLVYQPAGRALQHAFLLMALCNRIGGHLQFILSHGAYVGGVISDTSMMKVQHLGQTIVSVTAAEALTEIRSMDSHKGAVLSIVQMLDGETDVDGKIISVSKEQFDSSRATLNTLHSYAAYIFSKDGLAAKITEKVNALIYGETFAPINHDNIEKFLQYVSSGREDMMDDEPAWILDGAWAKTGIVARGLSMFGGQAPSMNYGGGSTCLSFNIVGDKAIDQLILKDSNTKKAPLPGIPFKPISFLAAVQQWETMLSSGKFNLVEGRKKKQERFNMTGVSFYQRDEKKLREILSACQACVVVLGKRGQKRGREEDAPVGQKSNKKSRVEVVDGF